MMILVSGSYNRSLLSHSNIGISRNSYQDRDRQKIILIPGDILNPMINQYSTMGQDFREVTEGHRKLAWVLCHYNRIYDFFLDKAGLNFCRSYAYLVNFSVGKVNVTWWQQSI